VHIEQGPVLNELDLPLGVVTSINGSVRYLGEVIGMASHAGTTPMDRRRDAAAAVAELVLYVERRAAAVPDVVGTVGLLQVPAGLDQRRARPLPLQPGPARHHRPARDALAADVRAELAAHLRAARPGVHARGDDGAAAAPSAPGLAGSAGKPPCRPSACRCTACPAAPATTR
jgi:N-carbamoyl-L-amino-acid hydrolase